MIARVRVKQSYEGIGEVMRLPQVRAALRKQAEGIAARARSLDRSEGGDATISVVEGTRPRGRAFARVVSDDVDGEFGTSKTARRRTLGRAANLPTE
jgi:hypothetical protein